MCVEWEMQMSPQRDVGRRRRSLPGPVDYNNDDHHDDHDDDDDDDALAEPSDSRWLIWTLLLPGLGPCTVERYQGLANQKANKASTHTHTRGWTRSVCV